jgi:hypothetical protein
MDDILVREQELRMKMADLINEAHLPAIVIEPILKDILQEVTIIKQQQYMNALKNVKEKKKDNAGKEKK